MSTPATHWHTPDPAQPVRRMSDGQRCARMFATRSDYPLIAKCACGSVIFCADGTADWTNDPKVVR